MSWNAVAVVYVFETKEVISVSVGGEGPPLLEDGQECIVTTMDYYNRFATEQDFLDAILGGSEGGGLPLEQQSNENNSQIPVGEGSQVLDGNGNGNAAEVPDETTGRKVSNPQVFGPEFDPSQ